jgi:predicted secreted hydrolase
MSSSGPYVLNGNNGYSVKQQDGGHASMYYSQPFINISGTLQLPEKVVEVSGKGWFDHEWSARLTDENTAGWDWFSLHLSNNSKLMVFRVRHTKLADSWFGTYISGNGQKIHLDGQDIQASARTFKSIQGRQIPLTWDIQVPKHNIQLNITAFKDDQWNDALFSYYEGAVTIQGSHTGVGFMELTGY